MDPQVNGLLRISVKKRVCMPLPAILLKIIRESEAIGMEDLKLTLNIRADARLI